MERDIPEPLLPFISVPSQGRRQLKECQTQRAVPLSSIPAPAPAPIPIPIAQHYSLRDLSGWAKLGGRRRLFCWAAVRLVRHRVAYVDDDERPSSAGSRSQVRSWLNLGYRHTRHAVDEPRGPKGGEIKEEAVDRSDGQTAAVAANEVIKLCSPGDPDPITRTVARKQLEIVWKIKLIN